MRIAPLFTWRSAVSSEHGPPSPITRHVLLALSLYMNERGGSAFPSIATLAADTALAERSVRTHLAQAVTDGWLERRSAGQSGRGWRRYEYVAVVPAGLDVRQEMPHDAPRGAAARAARQPRRAAPDDHDVRQEMPPISTSNSPVVRTTPSEGDAEYRRPVAALVERGVSPAQAEKVAEAHGTERVLAMCRRFDVENRALQAAGQHARRPGWLVMGIRDGWPADEIQAPPPVTARVATGPDAEAYRRAQEAELRAKPPDPAALAEAAAFLGRPSPQSP